MRQRGRKTNNDNLLKAVASRRTKLGLDDKPWSYNRVGLERAGGHKWKFSYGTVGEALEQLQVENKERWMGLKCWDLEFVLRDAGCNRMCIGFV